MKAQLNKLLLFLSLRIPSLVALLLIAVVLVASVIALRTLKFDYNIENFFSKGDADVAFYTNHKQVFENENDYLYIAVSNDNGVFDKSFLEKVDALSNNLEKKKNVEKVISPTKMSTYIKLYGLGFVKSEVLHFDDSEQLKLDKKKLSLSESYERGFFSKDFKSLNVVIGLKDSMSKKETKNLLSELRKEVGSYNFDGIHFAGRIRTQEYYLSQMQSEMGFFAGLALILVVLSLVIVLRNGVDALMILIVLFSSILMTFGIVSWLGYSIDLMMILLPTIILITGTSAGVHLLSRYRSYSENNLNLRLLNTMNAVGMPLLFNAITTAAGFLSLFFIPVEPIRKFGLFAAISIVITFLLIVVFIPAVIRLFGLQKTRVRQKSSSLSRLSWTPRSSTRMAVGCGVLLIGMVFGTTNLKINNYFLDDLSDKAELKMELVFFEKNFSGIRPIEISLTPKSNELTIENVIELDRIGNYLIEVHGVGGVTGPHQLFKSINKANHHGSNEFFTIPTNKSEFDKIKGIIEKKDLWNKFAPTYSKETGVVRVAGRANDVGSSVNIENNVKLNQFIVENIHEWDVQITGAAFLMDKANHEVSYNIMIGILMAILVSTLCIWWLTSSLKIALISILPNILPMLFAGGLMWVMGVPLKIGTAVVFTIIYGLAVDDTLHFVHRYNSNRKAGDSTMISILETFDYLKGPMSNTTIVLSAGFLIFGLSEFQSISMMGILIGASLIVALIVDMYILPFILLKTRV
jgi:predicted RND superfamily exporter protein